MTDLSMGTAKLSVGGVFSQSIATIRAKLLFFVFTGLLIGMAYVVHSRSGLQGSDPSAVSWNLVAIALVLLVVLGAVGGILCTRATAGPLGSDAGSEFAPAVQAALPKLLPVVLTSVLYGLIVVLGTLALVVPGVLAMTILGVCIPACILEDLSPIGALKRSRELTRGNRWRILGLFLISILVALGVGLVVSLPLDFASTVPGPGGFFFSVVSSAVDGLVATFSSVLSTHAFLELRRLKGEAAPASLI